MTFSGDHETKVKEKKGEGFSRWRKDNTSVLSSFADASRRTCSWYKIPIPLLFFSIFFFLDQSWLEISKRRVHIFIRDSPNHLRIRLSPRSSIYRYIYSCTLSIDDHACFATAKTPIKRLLNLYT